MNYSKLILVGFISAFVALLTSILGVAGTVIGSVISSVLYNMLAEALEKPVANAKIKKSNFEWDIAYAFPLIVIAFIQLMLIFALLAEWGVLPSGFLSMYLSLQNLASNNLYRLLGFALIVMSIYPFVLNPDHVNKTQGAIIAVVGLIFLARGFVDLGNAFTQIYDGVFIHFDLPIAIIAFVLLAIVIVRILSSAFKSREESNESNASRVVRQNIPPSKSHDSFEYKRKVSPVRRESSSNPSFRRRVRRNEPVEKSTQEIPVQHESRISRKIQRNKPEDEAPRHVETEVSKDIPAEDVSSKPHSGINKSSKNIQFESNDLLDEYKK